jgi:hypothetical protein
MEMIVFVLNILSAISAAIAAYFWWASSQVEAPKELGVARVARNNDTFGPNPEKRWAAETAELNSHGAKAAAVSALLMAFSTFAAQDWSIIR